MTVHKYSYRKSAVGTELVKYVILLTQVACYKEQYVFIEFTCFATTKSSR